LAALHSVFAASEGINHLTARSQRLQA